MSGLPTIAIDPGHNRPGDTGSSGCGMQEDALSLDVARKLELICKENNVKTVWCLPQKGTTLGESLKGRVQISDEARTDIFVSIHANAATPTTSAQGTEIYAISTEGKAIARRVLRNIVGLGFKERLDPIKTLLPSGYPPYVVKNTDAVGILVEICFLTSEADVLNLNRVGTQAIAQAIFDGLVELHNPPAATAKPETHPSFLQSSANVARKSTTTVLDKIVAGGCSTDAIKGLSDAIIKETGVQALIKFTAPNFFPTETCDPFFQPHVHAALAKVLAANRTIPMYVNSGYRTCVRQAMLWEFRQRSICDISLVANVGMSNHEQGCAIDIRNWQTWKPILIKAGWRWQGSNDPMHFELPARGNVARASIMAFQRINNQLFPDQKIGVDGSWGPKTRQAFLRCPANGGADEVIPYFDRVLRMGMDGEDVYQLALRLRAKGFYSRPIEHKRFEQPLIDAVTSYQNSIGVYADGIAGRISIAHLFEGVAPNPFAKFLD